MFRAPKPRVVVFDLDGTLIDSRTDLSHSVNATLRHVGRPELPEAVISSYIGDGASMLVRRALGDPEGDLHDQEYVAEAIMYFLDYYRIHKLDFTYVYDGVIEALSQIRAARPDLLMAVLTNKPVNPSRAICAELGLAEFFFQNYGGDSFHSKKPAPDGLLALQSEAAALAGQPISTAELVMIGDTDVDILTARNIGAGSIGCTFGFKPHSLAAAEPDFLAGTPLDWVRLLGI